MFRRRAIWQRRADRAQHPAKVIMLGFAGAVAIGTGLLSLPAATQSGERAPLIDALFTATSAVCVTGLITVDTPTYWTYFGQVVIIGLIQAGGLGIMTLATLFTVLVSRRLGLRARLLAQAETKALDLTDVRGVVRRIVLFSLGVEAIAAIILTARFATTYHEPFGRAVYDGVFHAISAFNNAGFSTRSDNIMSYLTDPWINLVLAAAVILGGLGFPVVFEIARSWRTPASFSVLTKITLALTTALLALGTIVFTIAESNNPDTFGPLSGPQKVIAGFFASAVARTAGFNSVNTGAMTSESLLATDALMFVGGGSAGTAGGIKVTTFGLLAFVLWSEIRGETHVTVGRRRIPERNQREALAIALLGLGVVVASTFLLLDITDFSLEVLLFEVISAFATVGLSTGITAQLSTVAQLVLIGLMFAGRVGPLTLASAMALRTRTRRYELPEERTIVG